MTRKDFTLIADIIGGLPPFMRRVVAEYFADRLSEQNERFNKGLFLFACNIPSE